MALQHDPRPRRARPRHLETSDAWKTGGGSVWVTGSYDPDLNLTYWGIGNPGPDWNPEQRPGDNLYTDSVVALDADTGTLKWHFQFTPNDGYDYDSVQVPVLVDCDWQGRPRKLMLWANRNGFFYVLDRVTGKFLPGKPFVKVNWASGLDANGPPDPNAAAGRCSRPILAIRAAPTGIRRRSARAPASSTSRRGRTTRRSIAGKNRATKPGRNFPGGGFTVLTPAPGAPTIGIGRRGPDQQLDQRGRQRRGDRPRPAAPASRSGSFPQYDVTDARHPDDGVRPAVHRRPRGLLLRPRRARPGDAVEGEPWRPDCHGARDVSGGRASSTCRSSPDTSSSPSRSETERPRAIGSTSRLTLAAPRATDAHRGSLRRRPQRISIGRGMTLDELVGALEREGHVFVATPTASRARGPSPGAATSSPSTAPRCCSRRPNCSCEKRRAEFPAPTSNRWRQAGVPLAPTPGATSHFMCASSHRPAGGGVEPASPVGSAVGIDRAARRVAPRGRWPRAAA